MIPDRFRSAFSSATLAAVQNQGSKLQVRQPLFFRGAYTAYVVENERRSFSPVVVLEPSRVTSARCTCAPALKPNDLCRHIAMLVARTAGESERFEASVWRNVGFACFTDGRMMDAHDSDPREQLLRKYVLTEAEQTLLQRGSGSARLQWETSPWYRWAKSKFIADDAPKIELRDSQVYFDDLALPNAAVEHIIPIARDFETGTADSSLRIDIADDRSLTFTPVVLDRGAVHVRAQLPQFGKYVLIGRRFVAVNPLPAMFVDDDRPLFGARERIGEADVFAFIERHRGELAKMPPELAPECVRNAQPVRLDGDVIFDFAPPHRDLLDVTITFEHGITAAEIAKARKDGVTALIRGNVWIDIGDPQFACLDHTAPYTKMELLRIRATLRGKALFKGDPSCEPVFRMYDELQTSTDAPATGLDLYGYQQTGYHWLWLLQQNGFGGLLCDDMGLGKTHQAMALIQAVTSTDPSAKVLVVCPTSVLDHWREKLKRYVPNANIELTSYGIVRARLEQYRGRRFELLVLDEMQTIKNAGTSTHQALRAIDKRIAVGLTGTPVENHERELHALLDFVVPGYLPRDAEDDRKLLQRLVRPFVLRRTKQQVLTQLPPKIVDKRYCELTDDQRAIYRKVMESRAKPLRMQLRGGVTISYVHVFAALNFLKQICNHPASAGGGFAENATSGKWELFTELLDECMSSGLKVVVFSQYLKMLELIEQHVASREIGFASIKGSTRERGAEIARFRDDDACRVFTASLRAGGLGIDLTSASVVIHYDRWWNQAREDQATDRVHRLGQNKGVQVIKLITRHTVEEKIDELIASKARLATEMIREDDPSLVKQFSRDELEDLLG
ncbi:MAG TPA: DEAD/DEAH box helicase [Thermoanaerobaculia bacterium]|nr:DEAD/DEAH box helicase [Thermoanaerobaculia bacterium]